MTPKRSDSSSSALTASASFGPFSTIAALASTLVPLFVGGCDPVDADYLRRLAADITREGGFPPLLLDPIDFAGLYLRRQQEEAKAKQSLKS